MALFLLLCTDRPDARELRAATREAHLAHLAKHTEAVKLAGPWLDEADGGPLGSMLVIEAADIDAAYAFAAADPYAKAGLFAAVEIRPWRRVVGVWA
jgi:uncharacterized protein YciI